MLQWTLGQVNLRYPVFSFFGYIPRSGIARIGGSSIFHFFQRSSTLFSIMVAPIYIPTNSTQGFSFLYILVWQIFWLKAPQREYPLLWKEPLPLLQNYYFKIGPPGWRGRWVGGSGWGIHVTPWLIHVNVWQNPRKCCEVISLQPIKKKNWTSSMGSD